MQNQPASPASPGGLAPRSLGEVEPVSSETEGPVQGGGYNAPAESDKNFIFRHKRLVGFLVIFGLFLTAVIVIASTVFFKKPQSEQQETVETAPFDVNTINKDSELPQTGAGE